MVGEIPHMIKNLPGVIGFLGETKGGSPVPMRLAEVNRILGKVDELSEAEGTISVSYLVGESVKVINGPFNGFNGLIEEINEEKKKIDRFAQMKQEIEETKEELENPKPESMKQELTEENTTADMTSYLSGPGKEGMKRVQNYDPYANAGNIVKGTHTEFMIKEHNLNDKNSENIQILLEDNFFKKKKLQSTKKDFSKFIVVK